MHLQTILPKSPPSGFTLVRRILGSLLLTAALLKAYDLFSAGILLDQQILPGRFESPIAAAEFILGVWLWSGWRPLFVWAVAVATFTAFASYSFSVAFRAHVSCGCFGRVAVSPWITFSMDLSAIAALFWFRPTVCPREQLSFGVRRLTSWHFAILASSFYCLLIGVSVAGGLSVGIGSDTDDEIAALDPKQWVGKPFPLAEHVDIGDQLSRGSWILLLYRHDCPQCQEALVNYRRLARNLNDDRRAVRVALIEVPPFGESQPLGGEFCERGRLIDSKEWTIATPSEIRLTDGKVIATGSAGSNGS